MMGDIFFIIIYADIFICLEYIDFIDIFILFELVDYEILLLFIFA